MFCIFFCFNNLVGIIPYFSVDIKIIVLEKAIGIIFEILILRIIKWKNSRTTKMLKRMNYADIINTRFH